MTGAVGQTSDSIKVSWTIPAEISASFSDLRISWRAVAIEPTPDWTHLDLSIDLREYVIDSLAPNTKYEFSVSGKLSTGKYGDPSDPINGVTLPGSM